MTDARLTPYEYNFLLPAHIAMWIEKAVIAFAREHGLEYDLWYRDLPTWIVSETGHQRVNSVQIDAVRTAEASLLAFTPLAYADTVEVIDGRIVETRSFPDEAAILELRSSLNVDQLIAPDAQPYLDDIERPIWRQLSTVWQRAASLVLTQSRQWESPMPLSS